MNERTERISRAEDLLSDDAPTAAEQRSLMRSLAALRRRRHRQRTIRIAVPLAAAAAGIFTGVLLLKTDSTRAITEPEVGSPPAYIVRSRPPADELIAGSRPTVERIRTFKSITRFTVVSSDRADPNRAFVSSKPPERLEFLTDSDLVAVLDGRPFVLYADADGQRRLSILDESDRDWSTEP